MEAEKPLRVRKLEKYTDIVVSIQSAVGLTDDMEWNATSLQLTSDLAAICVPATTLGLTNSNNGYTGLTNTLISLFGLYSA